MPRRFRHSPPAVAAASGRSRGARLLVTWVGVLAVAAGFVSIFVALSRSWQIALLLAGVAVGYLLLIGYRDQPSADPHDTHLD